MKTIRIDFGTRAAALYHGKRRMTAAQSDMLPDIWRLLEQIRIGKIKLSVRPGESMIYRRVIQDEQVSIAFYRPEKSEKGVEYDLLVMDIWWPADLN